MADAKNTGPSLRDMAYRAAGGGRKSSSNALVDAANKVFASYADQMADAAAQRRAARQEERKLKEFRSYEDEYDKQQARDKKKAKERRKNKQENCEARSRKNKK